MVTRRWASNRNSRSHKHLRPGKQSSPPAQTNATVSLNLMMRPLILITMRPAGPGCTAARLSPATDPSTIGRRQPWGSTMWTQKRPEPFGLWLFLEWLLAFFCLSFACGARDFDLPCVLCPSAGLPRAFANTAGQVFRATPFSVHQSAALFDLLEFFGTG